MGIAVENSCRSKQEWNVLIARHLKAIGLQLFEWSKQLYWYGKRPFESSAGRGGGDPLFDLEIRLLLNLHSILAANQSEETKHLSHRGRVLWKTLVSNLVGGSAWESVSLFIFVLQ
ncbi:hypothetical protein NPIL_560791 [Nephila pilipes]|uniref:Uncharacterized protein n=1 Tax=Nephila pilipes TaxID=299642 RepID=A0A8X6PX75_NEPPI|nr:hypothetical protein NPIL_560791 [Nephila pilipes]